METTGGAPLQTTAAAALGGENDDISSGDDIEYDEDGDGVARRKRNNKEFKADAYAAFASMGLNANSTIPVASVLMRSPDVKTDRDRCPRELWDLIQKHGGFAEKGLQGVTRQRILGQFRQWRHGVFLRASPLAEGGDPRRASRCQSGAHSVRRGHAYIRE